MAKSNILVVWSNYHKELAEKQLAGCEKLLQQSEYDYKVETVAAGSYEIPVVIEAYHHTNPFDAYIPLGLLLKGSTDHYEFIWEHLKECFIRFALEGILLGNGIISAPTQALLESRVNNGERTQEAVNAVKYLLQLKSRLANG